MEGRKTVLSNVGMVVGAVALLLAVVHFWAGPFTPKSSLEESVAEKAVSIKDATIAALKGEKVPVKPMVFNALDADKIANISTAILGAIALILAVVAFAKNEPPKAAGGAAILGAGALAFQFAVMALGAIVVVFLIAAVLGNLGVG